MNCVQPLITVVNIRLRDSVFSHRNKVEWDSCVYPNMIE